jgi:FlaA1/EpsC-like NDP-sugar epimerase
MGPQIRIGDLVDRLMRAGSERGFPPVPVHVIGLRPGEKLQEQLASQGISLNRTVDPRIWVARQAPALSSSRYDRSVRMLRRGVGRDEASAVLHALTTAVREFVPSAFAREIARQTDDRSALIRPRSLPNREARPQNRSRAA